MASLKSAMTEPAVGLAYSGLVSSFVKEHRGSADYVEIPFELLRHDPSVMGVKQCVPIVLHCATLSIAGNVKCPDSTIEQIARCALETKTPWIGEHLAFVTANRLEAGSDGDSYAPGEPYNIGYTVSPPMNKRIVDAVSSAIKFYQQRMPVPLLIENSPLYFHVPGSEMPQSAFVSQICANTNVGLLLDLAHLFISSRNMKFDAAQELLKFPLERVVEVHISGVDCAQQDAWDDHARAAPDGVYQLLESALERVTPRAITLEYNWSSRFSESALLSELKRVRDVISRARLRNVS